jgi:hypothetical protein
LEISKLVPSASTSNYLSNALIDMKLSLIPIFFAFSIYASENCQFPIDSIKTKSFENIQSEVFRIKAYCKSIILKNLLSLKEISSEQYLAIFTLETEACGSECELKTNQFLSHIDAACVRKNPDACFLREQFDYSLRKIQSMDFAMKYCGNGSSFACALLGYSMLDTDKEKARMILKRGCTLGSPMACKALSSYCSTSR